MAPDGGSDSAVRVRDATKDDLPRLVELLGQLSLDEPREDAGPPLPDRYSQAFSEIEADPRQRLFVVEVGERIVGAASLVIVPNLSHVGSPYAVVENVVVDASERGGRLGALLMERCVEEARQAGCYKLSLTSNKRRADAHRFYERLGFRATHEGYRVDL